MEARKSKKFSFEFFPPRTAEASEKLQATRDRLARLGPDFFSVTFGAGGTTREKTLETVIDIREKTEIESVPHISCMGSSLEQLKDILTVYQEQGFKHLVALRGDIPSGSVGTGELRYANELVAFIRAESGNHFHIEVACYPETHPQSASARQDLENFKRKVDAGADSALTQYFYNPYAYFRFIESCQKLNIDIPIVPGVMPITNVIQLARFSEMCGAEIPRWIMKRLQDFGDDKAAIREFGIDVTSELCEDLLANNAPGIHIYTMNQAQASEAIYRNLGLIKGNV